MSNEFTSKGSQTDWEALEKMEDKDIDLSEIPEVTAEQRAKEVGALVNLAVSLAKTNTMSKEYTNEFQGVLSLS